MTKYPMWKGIRIPNDELPIPPGIRGSEFGIPSSLRISSFVILEGNRHSSGDESPLPAGLLQQPADAKNGNADAGDDQRVLNADLFRPDDVARNADGQDDHPRDLEGAAEFVEHGCLAPGVLEL